ncbi:MAG: DUF6471 domain-containing protein [Oceanobacter sp.]
MKPEQSVINKASLSPYRDSISRFIRSTMILRNKRYEDLASGLEQRGIVLTSENLRSKVSKGAFAADLLIAIFDVLEVEEDALKKMRDIRQEDRGNNADKDSHGRSNSGK